MFVKVKGKLLLYCGKSLECDKGLHVMNFSEYLLRPDGK